jgi:hypothetical protein
MTVYSPMLARVGVGWTRGRSEPPVTATPAGHLDDRSPAEGVIDGAGRSHFSTAVARGTFCQRAPFGIRR